MSGGVIEDYSLACMSCPWRPNTWEKVAWLQVRVSSMAVPLAHAGGERGEQNDKGRSATLRHIKARKKREGEEGGLPSVAEAGL